MAAFIRIKIMAVWYIVTALYLGSICFNASGAMTSEMSAHDIVQKSSEVDKVSSWSAHAVMRLTAKNGSERVRESLNVNQLDKNGYDQKRLANFIAPADIKGTKVLIHEHRDGEDDIWVYLPSMNKVRRLVSSNKKDSFVGSDFSYTDILTPRVDDYDHTLLRRENLDNVPCFVIESVPKSDKIKRDTGYSRTVSWIRTDNFVRIQADFSDVGGLPYKHMHVSAVTEVSAHDGKWLIERVEMLDIQSGHRTEIIFKDIKVGRKADENMLSPNSLDRK